jgi:hypothetical protein
MNNFIVDKLLVQLWKQYFINNIEHQNCLVQVQIEVKNIPQTFMGHNLHEETQLPKWNACYN